MKGEYYVFCRNCGCSVFNTEARLNENGYWECRKHPEFKVHSLRTARPHDNMFIPKIVRVPSSTPNFGTSADRYWETAIEVWETIDCTWEDF